MGLFDGLKMMVDMTKAGIDAFKATEKMDKVAEKAINEFGSVLTEHDKAMHRRYLDFKAKKDAATGSDSSGDLVTQTEKAEVVFLKSVLKNPRVTQEFKAEIQEALDGYEQSEKAPEEFVENAMMKMAKTDAEKEEVRKAIEEVRAEDAAKKQ